MADELAAARHWISQATNVVGLTGAGISTDSGIPDFRGPQGLWTTNPKAEQLSDIRYYMADSEVRALAWQKRLELTAGAIEPNAGHHALAGLEESRRLHALVTQNVDGLHQRAGNSPDRVIEVHGTVHDTVCMNCHWRGPTRPILDRVEAGEADPPCERCGGILKTATVSFGQALVPEVIDRAMAAAEAADVLLTVGTSLQVYPIADAVPRAKDSGARVIIVNAEPTPFDDMADAVLPGRIGEILPALCQRG